MAVVLADNALLPNVAGAALDKVVSRLMRAQDRLSGEDVDDNNHHHDDDDDEKERKKKRRGRRTFKLKPSSHFLSPHRRAPRGREFSEPNRSLAHCPVVGPVRWRLVVVVSPHSLREIMPYRGGGLER